jgi:hypothetical protein
MERIRRPVKASIVSSEKVSQVNDSEALLYLFLLVRSDDDGRQDGSALSVKLRVGAGRKWSIERIESMLARLDEVDLITWYEAGGKQYIEVTDFDRHMTWHGVTKVLSDLPAPPEHQWHTSGTPVDSSPTVLEVKRREEKLSLEEEREEKSARAKPLNGQVDTLIEKASGIKGWTPDNDVLYFSNMLAEADMRTIELTIEDLRVYKLAPKRTYKNLHSALRTWVRREVDRKAGDNNGKADAKGSQSAGSRRVGYKAAGR